MAEPSHGLGESDQQNRIGPDLFGFYAREVADLLSQNEEFLPFSSKATEAENGLMRVLENGKRTHNSSHVNPLFSNSMEGVVPDIKRELLKALLREAVCTFSQEVDEMLDPIIRVHHILSHLRSKKENSRQAVPVRKATEGARKKLKMSASSSSVSMPVHASPVYLRSGGLESGSENMNSRSLNAAILEKRAPAITKKCAHCGTTDTPQCRTVMDGSKVCSSCGLRFLKGKDASPDRNSKGKLLLDMSKEAEKGAGEAKEDFQFLLEMENNEQLEELIKKHSDELSQTLNHMEQQLEELLDTAISNCRPMTRQEKHQLLKYIQKLQPKNLDRVVEIIGHKEPSETISSDEIFVDLEKQENITLWRLYFYVKAVENAGKLSA